LAVAGAVAALLLAFSAGAQPSEGWEISVGAPWRGFGTIELAAQDMTPGGAGLERFLDG